MDFDRSEPGVFKGTRSATLRRALLEKYDHTCQSCGLKDVPLELARITCVGDDATDEGDDYTILCPNCHRKLDSFQPREMELNVFFRDLLERSPHYDHTSIEQPLGDGRSYRSDLISFRKVSGREERVLIESKNRSFFRLHQIEDAIEQINKYRSLEKFDAAALAFPGRILPSSRELLESAEIEIWDIDYIATQFSDEIKQLPVSGFQQLFSRFRSSESSKSDLLLQKLSSCPVGHGGWIEYQRLVRDVFEFLFTPPLSQHIWESADLEKKNRRDIIFPNYASEGFWKFLRDSYNADFIIIDPKNYKNKIKKNHALQIANYLKPHGAGMFAIIVSRNGGDAGCLATIREQWTAYRKLIILLTDDDLKAMLLASESDRNPEDVIGEVIQEFRLSM
ncbi:hypothetical protein QEH59_06340 [Coraliomargarita sp. SDUM461004]|uniref:HNH endonuclease n=1 Tax=Thalassobacterium sedimentorum TaxID=3041258 RepID=A0ABU1AGT2_9BACT|nr:hypothetical protein [Coraliomargarita sp. SDUM461004]MDQ8194034.1 hypothetical protein [Coraliomargarita sp. SDUM461004]